MTKQRWVTLTSALVLAIGLGVSATVHPQENKYLPDHNDLPAPDPKAELLQAYDSADDLIARGRAWKSPELLLAAARIVGKVPSRSVNIKLDGLELKTSDYDQLMEAKDLIEEAVAMAAESNKDAVKTLGATILGDLKERDRGTANDIVDIVRFGMDVAKNQAAKQNAPPPPVNGAFNRASGTYTILPGRTITVGPYTIPKNVKTTFEIINVSDMNNNTGRLSVVVADATSYEAWVASKASTPNFKTWGISDARFFNPAPSVTFPNMSRRVALLIFQKPGVTSSKDPISVLIRKSP